MPEAANQQPVLYKVGVAVGRSIAAAANQVRQEFRQEFEDLPDPVAMSLVFGVGAVPDQEKTDNPPLVDEANVFTALQTFSAGTRSKHVALGTGSAIDLALGDVFSKTISGATTFTLSNVASSGHVSAFILELTNGGSASVTLWSGIKWAGGTAPTLTTSGVDLLGFITRDGGTTWRGFVLAKDSK